MLFVTEDVLLATRFLVAAVANDVPVSKKDNVDLLRSFAGEAQPKRSK